MADNYKVNPIKSLSEEVCKEVLNYIQSNNIENGFKLPTERNLSELLEVSRSSIREGIKMLTLTGFLESKQGGGTFVSNPNLFLPTYSLFEMSIKDSILKYYFEIYISLCKSIFEYHILSNKDEKLTMKFENWGSFNEHVMNLASKMKNPTYSQLVLSISNLLESNHFYHSFAFKQEIKTIAMHINNRDLVKFTESWFTVFNFEEEF